MAKSDTVLGRRRNREAFNEILDAPRPFFEVLVYRTSRGQVRYADARSPWNKRHGGMSSTGHRLLLRVWPKL